MIEFFRGWKRKVGCVTLMLACAFAAGWVKSRNEVDAVWLQISRKTAQLVYSSPIGIGWGRFEILDPLVRSRLPVGHFTAESVPAKKLDREFPVNWRDLPPDTDLFALQTFDRTTASHRARIWILRYSSIVLSLTAISAWLLLSRPRAKIEPPIADDRKP